VVAFGVQVRDTGRKCFALDDAFGALADLIFLE